MIISRPHNVRIVDRSRFRRIGQQNAIFPSLNAAKSQERLSREEKQDFPLWQLILHVRHRVFVRRDSASDCLARWKRFGVERFYLFSTALLTKRVDGPFETILARVPRIPFRSY